MLAVVKNFSDLNLRELEAVYSETISNLTATQYDPFPEDLFAEDLRNFFSIPGAAVYLWIENGYVVSALRAEPYLDGVLISYLETAPAMRGSGFAKVLLSAVIEHLESHQIKCVYSHVSRKNAPSLAVHYANGFSSILDYAKLLDGTISWNYYTLQYKSTAE